MRLLRNIFRRKLRAFLTIFGITIGVLALVVMGAMSEKLTLLVNGGVMYYKDKVIVTDAGAGGYGTMPISVRKVADLEHIDGVKRASASVGMLLDKEPPTVSFGQVPQISATDLRDVGYETFPVRLRAGRDLKPGDSRVCVVGSSLVGKLNAAVGGAPPYTWSLVSGSFPDGLSLSYGYVRGTPSAVGSSSFTLQVTDASGATALGLFTLEVAIPPLAISTASLPDGAVGSPYVWSLSATGGVPPYSWAVAQGALPAGVSLSADGALSGTVAAMGSFAFTLQAMDTAGANLVEPGTGLMRWYSVGVPTTLRNNLETVVLDHNFTNSQKFHYSWSRRNRCTRPSSPTTPSSSPPRELNCVTIGRSMVKPAMSRPSPGSLPGSSMKFPI